MVKKKQHSVCTELTSGQQAYKHTVNKTDLAYISSTYLINLKKMKMKF